MHLDDTACTAARTQPDRHNSRNASDWIGCMHVLVVRTRCNDGARQRHTVTTPCVVPRTNSNWACSYHYNIAGPALPANELACTDYSHFNSILYPSLFTMLTSSCKTICNNQVVHWYYFNFNEEEKASCRRGGVSQALRPWPRIASHRIAPRKGGG